MASAAGYTPITRLILPSRLSISSYPEVDLALTQWSPDGDLTHPSSPNKAKQRAWDLPKVQASYELLINTSQSPVARARLLGAASREAGAWLNAPPVSSLGLRMDDDAISICVGLPLGIPYAVPTSVVRVVPPLMCVLFMASAVLKSRKTPSSQCYE